jgi:hypothetical protein
VRFPLEFSGLCRRSLYTRAGSSSETSLATQLTNSLDMFHKKQRSLKSVWFGLSLALVAFSGAPLYGQLSWDTRQLDFHPKAEDAEVKGEFAFTNMGPTPVTITDVKTSCGCTTAALTKKIYAPGEKGAISTTFTIGDRVGLQQKQIVVRTDFPEEMFIQLTVRVFIPEFVKIEPQIVRWPLNGKNEMRIVKINVGPAQPVKVLGVRSTDDRIFAKLKTLEPGKRYEIEVSASVTNEPIRAFMRVETDFPLQKPKAYNIPVEVGDAPRPLPPPGALTTAPGLPTWVIPPSESPAGAVPPAAPGAAPVTAAPSVLAPVPVSSPVARPVVAAPVARAATPVKKTK